MVSVRAYFRGRRQLACAKKEAKHLLLGRPAKVCGVYPVGMVCRDGAQCVPVAHPLDLETWAVEDAVSLRGDLATVGTEACHLGEP